jgi:hypothetical protein
MYNYKITKIEELKHNLKILKDRQTNGGKADRQTNRKGDRQAEI